MVNGELDLVVSLCLLVALRMLPFFLCPCWWRVNCIYFLVKGESDSLLLVNGELDIVYFLVIGDWW